MGVRNAIRNRFGDADTVMEWGEMASKRESVMEYCVWKWMNFDCVYRVYSRDGCTVEWNRTEMDSPEASSMPALTTFSFQIRENNYRCSFSIDSRLTLQVYLLCSSPDHKSEDEEHEKSS